MKKPFLLLALALALSVQPLFAQDFTGRRREIKIEPPQERLSVGEELTYSVEWLGIPVLKVRLQVKEIKEVSGKECYHLLATAAPNDFFRMFYDVEHKVDSYIDTKTFLPVRFEKSRCEKNICSDLLMEFDREKNEAKISSDNIKTVKIQQNTLDLLSVIYYMRHLGLKEGGTYSANILYPQKTWPISITVKNAFLKDIRKKGTFSVIEIIPNTDLVGYLLDRRGAEAFFTADSKRIPILFIMNTKFGLLRGIIEDLPR